MPDTKVTVYVTDDIDFVEVRVPKRGRGPDAVHTVNVKEQLNPDRPIFYEGDAVYYAGEGDSASEASKAMLRYIVQVLYVPSEKQWRALLAPGLYKDQRVVNVPMRELKRALKEDLPETHFEE